MSDEPARATIEVVLQHGDKCPPVFYIGPVRHVIEPSHNAVGLNPAAKKLLNPTSELDEMAKRFEGCHGPKDRARMTCQMKAEELEKILPLLAAAHFKSCYCDVCEPLKVRISKLDEMAKEPA